MTDDTPTPRRYHIVDKAPEGFDPHDSLPVGVDDEDHGNDDEMEMDEDEALHYHASMLLPELPLITALLDANIPLDAHTLATAEVFCDEMQDSMDDGALDCAISALLLQSVDNIDLRRQYRELLTGEAQDMALCLEHALDSAMRHELEEAPLDARQLIFAGLVADIELAQDALGEDKITPDTAECTRIARLIEITSALGDIPPRLINRARDSFNDLADTAELPVHLQHDGYKLHAIKQDPTSLWKPRPPQP